MAKYKLKNSNNTVNCEILNESANEYIVRFNNGVVQNVSKDRVSHLDMIDEGVLDTIKGAAGAVNKYGRKFAEKAKELAQKVKEFFVKSLVIDNYVLFKDVNGDVIPAVHPINAMEGARNSNAVNYVPGTDTVNLCNELGLEPEAIENFEFDGEYEGAVQFEEFDDANTNESTKSSSSLLRTLFEANEEIRLKKEEKIDLHGTFCDYDQQDIVDTIYEEYMARYNGQDPQMLPLFIWGAPGIGKTAIIHSLKDIVKKETGKEITIFAINGGNVGPDDFTMPATIFKKASVEGSSNDDYDGQGKTSIKDLPKDWLPVYDARKNADINPELGNAIANGGGLIKNDDGTETIDNGPGGILFIDEYSRMSLAGMDALMQLPTTRKLGSNDTLTLGDRWVVVCAANRPEDMSRRGSSDALSFEGASKTRFNHCNFVPNPKDWVAWARQDSKRVNGQKNVLPDIVNYIEDQLKKHPDTFGDYYEMWKVPSGKLEGGKASACPRTWEATSWRLLTKMMYGRTKYTSVSSMPAKMIVELVSGIIGGDVAKRFAEFVAQFSVFTPKDAENVWTKGDGVMYDIIKQQKLNSANIEEFFTRHIFPMLNDNYPGGLANGVAPEAALNFMKFLEMCCYDKGNFNLNRFKTISTQFGLNFGVDLKSVSGPYADVANYKEDVIAKNELV